MSRNLVWGIDNYGDDILTASCVFGDERRLARVFIDTENDGRFHWEINMPGYMMVSSKPLFKFQDALMDVTSVIIENSSLFYNSEPVSMAEITDASDD